MPKEELPELANPDGPLQLLPMFSDKALIAELERRGWLGFIFTLPADEAIDTIKGIEAVRVGVLKND